MSGFLANDHLPLVLRLSANDKGENGIILQTIIIQEAVHKSLAIYLTAEEKLRKILARRSLIKGCATSQRLKWDTYFQIRSVGSHSTSGREKEGKRARERKNKQKTNTS